MKRVHFFLATALLSIDPAHAMSPEQCRAAGVSDADPAFGVCLATQSLTIGAKLSPEMRRCRQAGYRGGALGRCVISLLNQEEPGTAWSGLNAAGGTLESVEEPIGRNKRRAESNNYRDSQGSLQSYERKCAGPCCESRCVD
jgi:hypothetical protein